MEQVYTLDLKFSGHCDHADSISVRGTMDDRDLHIKYTKGSGPGGQHKNKVETCVVVTHLATGLQVRCQDTRSKSRNLKIAKERLQEKVDQRLKDLEDERKAIRRTAKIQNQKVIKTYNFNRNEVYDHRTKVRRDLERVLNGEIDY